MNSAGTLDAHCLVASASRVPCGNSACKASEQAEKQRQNKDLKSGGKVASSESEAA
jgi:hypothetical protein